MADPVAPTTDPEHGSMTGLILRADSLAIPLRSATVDAVVTSPPYLRQRKYGNSPHEGGRQETLAEYVQWLAGVFDELRRVMKPEAHAWLNIGDKANGSGGAGGDWKNEIASGRIPSDQFRGSRRGDQSRAKGDFNPPRSRGTGPGAFDDKAFEVASYVDVGGAVIAELLARRWRLRMSIVWDKGRQAPESLQHVRRPRLQHEMIFLLSPMPRGRTKGSPKPRFFPAMLEETGSIWHFPPGGDGPAHLAPFPDELARRCILPSTMPGDLVFDPFDGSGTTRRVAESLGRRGVGCDLYASRAHELETAVAVAAAEEKRITYRRRHAS